MTVTPHGMDDPSAGARASFNVVPDLLEEWVGGQATQARRVGTEPGAAVRRTPEWLVIVPTLVLLVALVVTFVVG